LELAAATKVAKRSELKFKHLNDREHAGVMLAVKACHQLRFASCKIHKLVLRSFGTASVTGEF
jgi:hypothetical protein